MDFVCKVRKDIRTSKSLLKYVLAKQVLKDYIYLKPVQAAIHLYKLSSPFDVKPIVKNLVVRKFTTIKQVQLDFQFVFCN